MADFKGRGGGPKRFTGGKPSFGGQGGKPGFPKKNWADRSDSRGDDRSTTLHKAICSKCGNECEVPFRPVNGKPVFCRNCFVKTGDTDTRGRAGDRFQSNDRFPKREFGPAATTRAEFPKTDNGPVLKQLEILNSKLDRLVSAIESMSAPKADAAAPIEVTEDLAEAVEKAVKTPKAKKATKAKTK
ncbi:MAG: hypothetical protein KBD06_00070 [Candidatus Pacebacteria bacterium]|nr:hypothetical protein [Candidatus Paceibacterota bacterium]